MERLLRPIFVCLPLPRGIDGEALLGQYHYALAGLSLEALKSVVSKLVKGTWGEEMRFCPRPPQLANMVRQEERRLRAALPAAASPAGPARAWTGGKPPLFAAMQKKCARRTVLARDVAAAAFRAREWPVGSVYVPILGCVFAPDAPYAPDVSDGNRPLVEARSVDSAVADGSDTFLDALGAETGRVLA
ncbi:hypothetical protein [Oryzifoliimicrobium ureilyticus]|uniref:hypothetical protein n=1 Tax=Oryzifoliimicrobium ureilyticus TaxID=3113724 RepID=UPI00307675AB